MPHLVIEYTNNLRDRFDARVELAELNRELDAVGEFVSEDIKSRARALDTFVVGLSGLEEAFIHGNDDSTFQHRTRQFGC